MDKRLQRNFVLSMNFYSRPSSFPVRWMRTENNGGHGDLVEDESKLWTFILPDGIISSDVSSKICKLT